MTSTITHIEICGIDTKQQDLQGALKIHLDVAPKRTDVKVTPSGRAPSADHGRSQ